jgi:hypothetical protein
VGRQIASPFLDGALLGVSQEALRGEANSFVITVSADLNFATDMQIPAGLQPTGISRKDDRRRLI